MYNNLKYQNTISTITNCKNRKRRWRIVIKKINDETKNLTFDNLSMSNSFVQYAIRRLHYFTIYSIYIKFVFDSFFFILFLTKRWLFLVAELNSTSPSTSELGELVDEAESDEANADNADDEDAVEDILYMRGATFTIHLDAPAKNSTADATKINEGKGADQIELRATSQVTLRAIFPGLACRIAA